VKLEEEFLECEAWITEDYKVPWRTVNDEERRRTWCGFREVTFTKDTKLNIKRYGLDNVPDGGIKTILFETSSMSLIHPDILAKFPNIEEIAVDASNSQSYLNSPIENCQSIKIFTLALNGTEIPSDFFKNCKNLKKMDISSDSLTELPDGIFKNQPNLKELELDGKKLKFRESLFEGLKKLSILKLNSIDLSQDELKDHTFPIESLNSHQFLEELLIESSNMEQLPENFVPTLRSLSKLRVLTLPLNLITSVEAFTDLPNVEWLLLNNNKIEEIPTDAFKGCPRLSKLHLDNNPIKELRGDEFDQLTGLVELDLAGTKITNIEPTTFQKLTALETLNLSSSYLLKEKPL
jgi:Leucine-rich repeat (LRR) protein